jgi:uncharacterized membrane protein YdjX (TVP38/TMEM64 family)
MQASPSATGGTRTPRGMLAARLGLIAVAVAALGGAYAAGAFDDLSDPKAFARWLVALGGWGQAAFVLAYAALQPFGVPGTVFIVAAPLIWPWPTAFALSMLGTMLASVIGFAFARFIARDFIAARIPARFRKYDQALERNAFQTVFILRLIFWMPQMLHAFLGVSKVPFWTHFWGSLLGYLAPLFLVSYYGAELFTASGGMSERAWVVLGSLLAVSLLVVWGLRWLQRRRGEGAARS